MVSVSKLFKFGTVFDLGSPGKFTKSVCFTRSVKLIGRWKDDRAADRFTAAPGLNFFSFNLRPPTTGSAPVERRLYHGARVPEGAALEDPATTDASFPAEVVEWGTLRLRTSHPARVYIVGSDELAYVTYGRLLRIAWSSGLLPP
jgi:hypothetical protein